jgi:hypothetical protein
MECTPGGHFLHFNNNSQPGGSWLDQPCLKDTFPIIFRNTLPPGESYSVSYVITQKGEYHFTLATSSVQVSRKVRKWNCVNIDLHVN